ncbi:hypothetical protein Tco_0657943 [Tanacetum coccineum]|uniref:Uncharacterized protein n=1 Tax=Tanacetum coccineum TaxID=301880 RepID=A0ABQ5AV01_9ASTR
MDFWAKMGSVPLTEPCEPCAPADTNAARWLSPTATIFLLTTVIDVRMTNTQKHPPALRLTVLSQPVAPAKQHKWLHMAENQKSSMVQKLKEVEPPAEGQSSNAQAVQAVEAWKHSDFLCHNYVLNGLIDPLYNVYCKTTTAKELWESLKHKYKTEDAGIKKIRW